MVYSRTGQKLYYSKLSTPTGSLPNPVMNSDISGLPVIKSFDIFNDITTDENHQPGSIRELTDMEGYSMFLGGYVGSIKCSRYETNPAYFAVHGHVKLRTCDKDSASGLTYYRCWLILKSLDTGHTFVEEPTPIYSACCSCKGGVNGYCRHVVAILVDIHDFFHDGKWRSVTSGECLWVARRKKSPEQATLIIDLGLCRTSTDPIVDKPFYNPLDDQTPLPSPENFVVLVKTHLPNACFLDAWEMRRLPNSKTYPPLSVATTTEKIFTFLACHVCTEPPICSEQCLDELEMFLQLSPDEATELEHVSYCSGIHRLPISSNKDSDILIQCLLICQTMLFQRTISGRV